MHCTPFGVGQTASPRLANADERDLSPIGHMCVASAMSFLFPFAEDGDVMCVGARIRATVATFYRPRDFCPERENSVMLTIAF
jgi:hypothetical protein